VRAAPWRAAAGACSSGPRAARSICPTRVYITLALFVAVGLVSIPPTRPFLSWNCALTAGEGRVLTGAQIASVRRYLLLELALLAFIPFCAVLTTRAVGPAR
jgi:putative membrane protein